MSFFELLILCCYIAAHDSKNKVQTPCHKYNKTLTLSFSFYYNDSIHTSGEGKVVACGSEISAIFNTSQYQPFFDSDSEQFLSNFPGTVRVLKIPEAKEWHSGRKTEPALKPMIMHELFTQIPFFPVRLSTRQGWISPGPHSPVMRA